MRNKSRLAGLFVALFVALSALAFTGTSAQATKPNPEHKVWVCHATSGLGELKNGYNLIHVDVASTKGQAHLAHATTDPKNNSRFGLLYDYIGVEPNNLPGKCGETPTPPEQPDDIVEVTPWVDGTFECEETMVEQTRIVTTTVYVLVDGEWVKGQPTSEEETQTRELSQDEIFACPTTPTTLPPETTQPPPTTVPPTTEPPETTQPPVTTQPPTTEPPATTQPPVVATTEPPTVSIGTAPVPPSQPSVPPTFTPTATPSDELPATGVSNGLFLLIAAGMLGAGALLAAAARRRNATI